MEIEKILKMEAVFHQVIARGEESRERIFRRWSYDNWAELMGDSWEPVYSFEVVKELEKQFQSPRGSYLEVQGGVNNAIL